MTERANSPVQRLAQNLRGISRISLQVARTEIEDQKVIKDRPGLKRKMAQRFRDSADVLDEWADEDETLFTRREEDMEALVTISRMSANISTVLGSDGGNLEILTHSDPEYVLGVLLRATEEARREAVSKMPVEEKEKWLRWLGGGGLDTIGEIAQIARDQAAKEIKALAARLAALIEKLPEGSLKEEEKEELMALLPPELKE